MLCNGEAGPRGEANGMLCNGEAGPRGEAERDAHCNGDRLGGVDSGGCPRRANGSPAAEPATLRTVR
jgi:hypothetical protein